MEFRDAKRALKAVYSHSDSESSDNECRKTLHVMFGGSWAITSRRVIKTLHREVVAAAPTSKAAPHHKWVETLIGFDSSDWPKSMAGTGQLLLLVSPTMSNVKLYHVLIDGGAAHQPCGLQEVADTDGEAPAVTPILRSRPSVGYPVWLHLPLGHIRDGTELPHGERTLRCCKGQPPVQRHYRYLVLKMLSPNGVLKIRGDRDAGVCPLEKLQALAAAHEAVEEPGGQDPAPSSSR
jgi:hypothetical protein